MRHAASKQLDGIVQSRDGPIRYTRFAMPINWTSASKVPRVGPVIVSPKTARGRATRERIVAAASELIGERGIAETSLDDVIERAGASKSQLYHYFDDRSALLRAVVDHNRERVLADLRPLDGWGAIRSWFDSLVELQVERRACRGCPIGSLVGQLAESDEQARLALAGSFDEWESRLRDGLRSMQRSGKLAPSADPSELATVALAAIQGGLLLTQTRRDPGQLATALDAAYAHLRAHASSPRAVL
jgi:TetR/AcrR family transcriptional regulator, transcriptional repressor for nem operon